MLAAAVAVVSCSPESHTGGEDPVGKIEAKFDTNISPIQETRVAGDEFETNDHVGLYMKPAGMGLTAATVANAQMSVESDGTLSSADPIHYPEDGNVDFIAYYPYNTIENNRLLISVNQDQSYRLPSEVLYSDNATNKAASEEKVNLNFGYILPKIVLTVTATDESEFDASHFENIMVTMEGMRLFDYLDINTGSVVGEVRDLATITMGKFNYDATSATFEALVLPMETAAEVLFNFHLNGAVYTYPVTDEYLSGKQYNLSFELNVPGPPEEPTVVLAGTTITPRTPEDRDYEFNALATPTNLRVEGIKVIEETGRLQNTFTWDAVDGASMYEFVLYTRPTGSGQPFEIEYLGRTDVPEMILTGFPPAFDCRWSVKALRYYEATREVYGPAFSIDEYPLVPPTGLVAKEVYSNAAIFVWNPVIGANGYQVELNGNPDLVFMAGGFSLDPLSFAARDLAPGQNQSVRVRARMGDDYSDWSNSVDFVTTSVTWDMNTFSGMTYTTVANPMNPEWPSSWTSGISHVGYTYRFTNGFATQYDLPISVRSDRFFLDDAYSLGLMRLEDGNVVAFRAVGFQLVENGTMIRVVPMTGCNIELTWNETMRTFTFPTTYDGFELVFGIYAFLFDETTTNLLGYYGSASSYYSNVVLTINETSGAAHMTGTQVDIDPSRIEVMGPAFATTETPVRGIVTGNMYYTE